MKVLAAKTWCMFENIKELEGALADPSGRSVYGVGLGRVVGSNTVGAMHFCLL
jgi:hypothetical protein